MLNLTDLPVANFPDGHRHLIVPEGFDIGNETTLKVSIRSFDDLFLLAQAKQILPNLKYLYILYLLGARCDRRFSDGEAFDLKIVASFINAIGFERVRILKPHSTVALELINNSVAAERTPHLLEECFYQENIDERYNYRYISPDKGASLWIAEVVEDPGRIIQCEKYRDTSAEHRHVSKIVVPKLPEGIENYIIIDDLCDGGGTFLGIAKQLREKGAQRIFLVVTHAIMSKGLDVFEGLIDKVYCTNSFKDFDHKLIFQKDVQND